MGYSSKYSKNKGVGLVFARLKCTLWGSICQTIYQIKDNVQSYNKSHLNILLSVIIWTYGQSMISHKGDNCKLKYAKTVLHMLLLVLDKNGLNHI